MTDGESMHVLVVCAANQCRSRAAEAILRLHLADLPELRITSAGTHVLETMPMCDEASNFVLALGAAPALDVPSRELTVDALQTADLVLTSDVQVRSDVVALSPDARSNTFTLTQAGAGAAHLLTHDLVRRAREAHAAGLPHVVERDGEETIIVAGALRTGLPDAAQWLAEELAAARGVAPPDRGLDIPDAHTEWRTPHRRTLEAVLTATNALARLLQELRRPA